MITRICTECGTTTDYRAIVCPKCGGEDTLEIALRCCDCGSEVPYSESITLRTSKKAYCNKCVRERMVWFRDFIQTDGQACVQLLHASV